MPGVLQFLRRRKPVPAPPPDSGRHYGLFSVGAGDVIVSKPLYEVLVEHLRSGSLESRMELADRLEELVRGMY